MSKQKRKNKWVCTLCESIFETRALLQNHRHSDHKISGMGWSKGKNLPEFFGKERFEEFTARSTTSRLKSPHFKDAEYRKKLSNSLKMAWKRNGITSSWTHKESYAEKYFTEIINNNFDDKVFSKQYHLGTYFVDFAWINKKIYLEIDGEQHYKNQDNIKHDLIRNKFLEELGWRGIRIRWAMWKQDTFKKDECIKFLNGFINGTIDSYSEFTNLLVETSLYKSDIDEEVKSRISKYEEKQNLKKEDFSNLENPKALSKKKVRCSRSEAAVLNNKKRFSELRSRRRELIENSGIDFSKFGWVGKVAELIGISPSKVNVFMKRNMPEFYATKCFIRKNSLDKS